MLPHAGASAPVFRAWSPCVPDDVEICAVQLPGRGERFREPAIDDMRALTNALVEQVAQWVDVPYLIFGHSFGALAGFELTRALRRRRLPAPMRLVVSGRRAPSIATLSQMHLLPDAELEARIRRFGGTPDAILDEPEVRALFFELIRADFKAIETYKYEPDDLLTVPLSIFCGDADPEAPVELMRPWQRESGGPCSLHVISGGHFFALENPQIVARHLIEDLAAEPLRSNPDKTIESNRATVFVEQSPGSGE